MVPAGRLTANPRRLAAGTLVRRSVLFGAFWLVLTGGDLRSWTIGLPATALAVAASFAVGLELPGPWRIGGAVGFASFFLRRALAGGVDVTRRVLHPGLPIDPDLLSFELRLPEGPACVLLADVMSLLPGTLTAQLEGRTLLLHVVDARLPIAADLRGAERAVAALLGVELCGGSELPSDSQEEE